MTTRSAAGGFGCRKTALVLALAALVLTLLRVLPVGPPIVFADEYLYAAWTNYMHAGLGRPELVPDLGNWLYLRVYEFVHVGHGDFLGSARVLNAMFAATGAAVVFALARRWAGTATAALLAISYSVLFIGSYAAYFMPESMFYAACAALLLVLSRYVVAPGIAAVVLLGVAGAMATSIKGHGLLLLPAMLVGVLAAHRVEWRAKLGQMARDSLILVFSWWGTSVLIGGLLGDHWVLNPLGGFYTEVASGSASSLGPERVGQVVKLAGSHLATIALVTGLPVLIAAIHSIKWLVRPATDGADRELAPITLAMLCALGGMFAVSVVFTVTQAGVGPYETLTRLHGRYYEHLLQLTAICGVLAAPRLLQSLRSPMRWVLGVVAIVLVIVGTWSTGLIGWQNLNDFSAAFALFASPSARYYASLIAIVAIVWSVAVPRKSHVVLAAALLVWLALNSYQTERLRYSLTALPSDRAAELIAQAEAGGDRAQVLIVSPTFSAELYRVAFQLVDEDVKVQIGASPVACPGKDSGLRWVVALGKEPLACGAAQMLEIEDLKVGRVSEAAPTP